jgi:hypothetical protein
MGETQSQQPEAFHRISSLDVTVNDRLARAGIQLDVRREEAEESSPIRDIGPKVVALKALPTPLRVMARITEGPILPVQHVVGAEQPEVMKRVDHRIPDTSAGKMRSQCRARDVVDVDHVGP